MSRYALAVLFALAALLLAAPVAADAIDDEAAKGAAAAEAGDQKTAATAYTRAVGLARKKRGKDDASVGPLALEAGKALLASHNIDRAIAALTISVKNTQINHGKVSLKNAEPLEVLAEASERNSDYTKARKYHEQHIKVLRLSTGEDSLRSANALLAAARLDVKREYFSIARRRMRDASKGFKKAGEEGKAGLAEAQVLTGVAYILDSVDWKKNLPLGGESVREGIQAYEAHYPLGSPEIITMYEQLLLQVNGTPVAERMGDKLTVRLAQHKAAR